MDRRSFLKVGAWAGGGLVLGAYFGLGGAAALAQSAPVGGAAVDFSPNVFLRIAPDGAVSLIAPNTEMGQGAKTSLPLLIAEELDVAWSQVTVTQGDLNRAYGGQFAVGSQSTMTNYTPLRQAGAMARAMLVAAAAQTWSVPEGECTTAEGAVIHAASSRRLTYGALTALAATLPVPQGVALKDAKNFKLVGTRIKGVDNQLIVTGQPLYGIDKKLPGMVYAAYIKCPVFGGKPVSANLDAVKKLPGVSDAFLLDGINGLVPGVAIIADSTWSAFSAAGKLEVKWDEGTGGSQNSTDMAKQAATMAATAPALNLAPTDKSLEAIYHYPFLAHATLEPQNCTAVFKDGVMEMWCPTQVPSTGQGLVTGGLGLQAANVIVHVPRVGGGFGRRGSNEYSLEVAAIAHKLAGTPVKLTWMREHDFAHDNYRSNGWHFFKAGVDTAGKITGLQDYFVKMTGGPGDMNGGGFPFNAVPGSTVQEGKLAGSIPTGYWRAPGDNGNVWATQSFVDELAHAADRDPMEFTMKLLQSLPAAGGRGAAPGGAARGGGRGGRGGGGFVAARMIPVLQLAGDKADWGKKLPRGTGMGLAISNTNGAYVAVIAEVSVSQQGELKIQKLTAAVDAGQIVNLSAAENQVQGSLLDGIGAAWFLKVTIEKGAAAQGNFDEYPLIRMDHTPAVVDVHFLPSNGAPAGLGEPALPPAAPAVCNAIFAATGKRIRTLPFAAEDLKWS